MKIKVNAFPALFLYARCTKHNCNVEIRVEESKAYLKTETIGAQITTMRCEKGGVSSESDCTGNWETVISASGEIKIVN